MRGWGAVGVGGGTYAEPAIFTMHSLITITGGSCHKYHFCHDKSFVQNIFVMTKLSYFCLTKDVFFVATNTCLSGQNFCRDKK